MNIDFDTHTRMYLGLYEREIRRDVLRFARPGAKVIDLGNAWLLPGLPAKETPAITIIFMVIPMLALWLILGRWAAHITLQPTPGHAAVAAGQEPAHAP